MKLELNENIREAWEWCRQNGRFHLVEFFVERDGRRRFFNYLRLDPDRPSFTVAASTPPLHFSEPRYITAAEARRIQSFPEDFDFNGQSPYYLCGMSVPPLMMQRLATEVSKMLTQEKKPELVTGPWTLEDLRSGKLGSPKQGLKVFSCFHCGGGSTMGYKLAGLDVLGGVEIDPEMMAIYRKNHEPRHSYLMGVQEFNELQDIPEELKNLDILDGSPPCSSFSMAGNREKNWGESKKFREGQAEQVLDDLFFHFIRTAKKLQPKVVIAENVKGMLMGNAKGYVKEIFEQFRAAGYETQLFLLNASRMGVPQARERVFFVARRADLGLPKLSLDFNEPPIPVARAIERCNVDQADRDCMRGEKITRYWNLASPGDTLAKFDPKGSFFNAKKLNPAIPAPTIASGSAHCQYHWGERRRLSNHEILRLQSFPEDYDFLESRPRYVLGMSVPPLMMQRLASAIADLFKSAASPA